MNIINLKKFFLSKSNNSLFTSKKGKPIISFLDTKSYYSQALHFGYSEELENQLLKSKDVCDLFLCLSFFKSDTEKIIKRIYKLDKQYLINFVLTNMKNDQSFRLTQEKNTKILEICKLIPGMKKALMDLMIEDIIE